MPRRSILFLSLLALSAAVIVGASANDTATVVEAIDLQVVTEQQQPEPVETPINPETGLPAIQWVNGPIPGPGGEGGGGGGTGGGGGNYICSATFQCPGDASIGVDPYTISCQGEYSCQTFSCGIKCDGNGIGCIPGPMC